MRMLSKLVIVPAAALVLTGCDQSKESPEAEAPAPVSAQTDAPKKKKKAGSDDRYATPRPEGSVTAGTESEVVFRIEPRGDLKINKEYPWSIDFEPGDGVTLAATSLKKDALDLADERAEIPVKLTAGKAGEHTLAATGNFSVCNPQRCDILRDEPLEFTVVAVAGEAETAEEGAAAAGEEKKADDVEAQ